VEALNGADSASVNGVRSLKPAAMMEALAEVEQKRFFKRKEEAQGFTGAIPPLVKQKLDKKLDQLTKSTYIEVSFKGKDRNKVTLTIGERKLTRKVDFSGLVPKCECLSAEVDEFPCGCMLLAAEKAGKPWAELLWPHGTVATWKEQYANSVDFDVPGSEQLASMEPDTYLLPPAAFPIPRGRPSTKRKKGLVEEFKIKKTTAKKARCSAAAAAAASSSSSSSSGS